jgi:hypothetical protein
MKPYRRGSAVSSGGRGAASPVLSSPRSVAPSQEAIARRAYLKWQARGCPSGTHLQDWLEAEAELKAELGQGRRP